MERFDHDFNCIPLFLLEKAYPELFEYVVYPDGYDYENEEEPLYPMWGTLFEAKNKFLGEILLDKKNELAKISIYLMYIPDSDLNTMMFIMGAGYSFEDHHWKPLYEKVLK